MQPDHRNTLWSTVGIQPSLALDYWSGIVGQAMFGVKISTPAKRFHAELQQIALGPMLASCLNIGPQSVVWTPSQAVAKDDQFFDLLLPCKGTATFEQVDHEGRLAPGDCVVLDRSKPFQISNGEMKGLQLAIPYQWLSARIPDPQVLSGQPIRGREGWGKVLATLLSQIVLSDHRSRLSMSGQVHVADHIAFLLSMACGSGADVPATDYTSTFNRAKDVLRQNLHEPELDPNRVATVLGVSKRLLHLAFAQHDTSLGRELMDIRLDRASELLSDPRFASIAVGEIAFKCGFLDQSHFAKRFKARFQRTASSLRK